MSVGSFVLGGVGGGSTVALFINEGFGFSVAAVVPVVASVGGMVRRGKRRFEIVIDDVRFSARSPAQLQSKVAAWRRGHIPANDPRPQPKPAKEVVPDRSGIRTEHPETARDTATPPALPVASPGAVPFPLAAPRDVVFPPPAPLPPGQAATAAQATIAHHMAQIAHQEAAQRELHAAMAHHAAGDEDDVQALMAILEHAA